MSKDEILVWTFTVIVEEYDDEEVVVIFAKNTDEAIEKFDRYCQVAFKCGCDDLLYYHTRVSRISKLVNPIPNIPLALPEHMYHGDLERRRRAMDIRMRGMYT